jgi:hypothetical protein
MTKLVLSAIVSIVVTIGTYAIAMAHGTEHEVAVGIGFAIAMTFATATMAVATATVAAASTTTVAAAAIITVLVIPLAIAPTVIGTAFAIAPLAIAAVSVFGTTAAKELGIKQRWAFTICGMEAGTIVLALFTPTPILAIMVGLGGVAVLALIGYLGRARAMVTA